MAYGYRSGDRQQLFLLPPSMDEWLEEGHLAYFVIDTVKLIDTTAFHEIHPEGPGRPAYEPEMMLGLLLYAYATGLRSSRKIMAACRSDLAYKVIAVNLVPDHRTIARFRAENEEAIRSVFVEVLKLCDAAGLASLGQIAIDGTKIGSDAALDQNRGKDWIRREINKILGEAEAVDAEEDASPSLFSAELPEGLRRRHGRLERLRAALAVIEAQDKTVREDQESKADHARREAAQGRKLRGRKPKDPHAALVRAEADLQALRVRAETDPHVDVESAKTRVVEATAAAEAAPSSPEVVVANITDPDSAIMKTTSGWVQGFNIQAAVNADQVVVAYEATQDLGRREPVPPDAPSCTSRNASCRHPKRYRTGARRCGLLVRDQRDYHRS